MFFNSNCSSMPVVPGVYNDPCREHALFASHCKDEYLQNSIKKIVAYEKRGTSKRYTWYCLPANCDTVFFPGCALPGTRPGKFFALYQHLKALIPGIGVVLDCCCKISRDLGRTRHYADMLSEMKSFLLKHGVKRILTACPNCHMIFIADGTPLEAINVYATLVENGLPPGQIADGRTITVHDPCTARHEPAIHNAARAPGPLKRPVCYRNGSFRQKNLLLRRGRRSSIQGPDSVRFLEGQKNHRGGRPPYDHLLCRMHPGIEKQKTCFAHTGPAA